MAYDFPASPTSGQTVTFDTTTWQWNGTYWVMQSGNVGAKGDKGDKGDTGATGATGAQGPQGESGTVIGAYTKPEADAKFVDVAGDAMSGHLTPTVTGTINLGSATLRWGTVYTSDLSLSNGVGDWTIVEGEHDLFITNNKTGRRYKFALLEVE